MTDPLRLIAALLAVVLLSFGIVTAKGNRQQANFLILLLFLLAVMGAYRLMGDLIILR
mgnify:CR=1 FL=1